MSDHDNAPAPPVPSGGSPTSAKWLEKHLGGFFLPPVHQPGSPGGAGPAVPIGVDQRILVNRPYDTMPFAMICWIGVTKVNHGASAGGFGTGFLVGPRTVLTAAHVLLNKRENVDAAEVELRFGKDGSAQAGSPIRIGQDSFRFHPGWTKNSQPEIADMAAIRLPKSVTMADWFWLGETHYDATEISNHYAHIAGYPDKVVGQSNAGQRCYMHRDVIERLTEQAPQIKYLVDTSRGNSGGPVYLYPDPRGKAGVTTVVGVHAYAGDLVNGKYKNNKATRLNAANHALVRQWIAEDMAAP